VWCLFVLSALLLGGEPNEARLPFESSVVLDAMLVRVKVNGRPAVLIFDTGSNCTILSPELASVGSKAGDFIVSFPEDHRLRRAAWASVTLQIDHQILKGRRVVVQDQGEVSTVFKQRIDGILGKDVLNEYRRVTIDLKDRVIVFSR
jgi:hypothetical protein